MDSSLALPLCALSACRSARMQSLLRVLIIAVLIVAGSVSGAKAGGLFDGILGLFGLQAPQAIDPTPRIDPLGYSSGQKAFCVRQCDGRYFPIASAGNATPVQMCSAMCPAAKTRIYRGGEIDSSVDERGARYGDLDKAFAYRTAVVPSCTCNGKEPFGLVSTEVMTDPTLQAGDIVATADGLKVFQGAQGDAHRAADFAPAAKSGWVSRDLRSRLSKLKVSEKR